MNNSKPLNDFFKRKTSQWEESSSGYGRKLMLYISYVIRGKSYPSGKLADDKGQKKAAKDQLLTAIFKEEKEMLTLKLLFMVDSGQVFIILREIVFNQKHEERDICVWLLKLKELYFLEVSFSLIKLARVGPYHMRLT